MRGGGGVPHPHPYPRSGVGGTPSQAWMVGGGVPQPGLDGGEGGGVPQPGLDGGGEPQPGLDGGGGYPSQVWMVGGTPARSGWWGVGGVHAGGLSCFAEIFTFSSGAPTNLSSTRQELHDSTMKGLCEINKHLL